MMSKKRESNRFVKSFTTRRPVQNPILTTLKTTLQGKQNEPSLKSIRPVLVEI